MHCIPHTEEAKRKISLALKGVPAPYNCKKSKIVDGIILFECTGCYEFLPKDCFYTEHKTSVRIGITSKCKKCSMRTNLRTRNTGNARRLNREYMRRLRQNKPELIRMRERIASQIRRALKANSQIGDISFEAIRIRDRMICGLCHKRVKEKDLAFDHVIPLSCGGAHTENNLQVAHRKCNLYKYNGVIPSQTRLPIDYGFEVSKCIS